MFSWKEKKYCKALCFPLSSVLRFQFLVCKLPGNRSMTSGFLFIAFCIMKWCNTLPELKETWKKHTCAPIPIFPFINITKLFKVNAFGKQNHSCVFKYVMVWQSPNLLRNSSFWEVWAKYFGHIFLVSWQYSDYFQRKRFPYDWK